MPLGPTIIERLNRARADLRMGVPVVLADMRGAALVVAAEEVDAARLADCARWAASWRWRSPTGERQR
ncbi:GTP cyclohydrolase II [Frigidibacter mobilis]|uniref:GTP cyclohydrolase II n=1 Tax=Frigidibacter mobilis TaxID=1335048 RepID=A0A159Z8J2_9RHOB|nr:GTP cyclohydrolase II [Frigidibacter mobilis]